MAEQKAPEALFDRDQSMSASYEQGPRWFVPGYDLGHALAALILRERLGHEARILVVGAGGGMELATLAAESPGWSFLGLDPSAQMLELARQKVESLGLGPRVSLVQGYLEDAPPGRFDAALAFLVLNFIPDDGRRLEALKAIHGRLAPGAPFLMVNGCSQMGTPRFEEDLRLYVAWAQRQGAPQEAIAKAVAMQRETLFSLPRQREEELLARAGFREARLFYGGLWILGWMALA